MIAAAANLLGVAAVVGWQWRQEATRAGQSSDASIAVLPFENLSADPEVMRFTQGIHEGISADLSRIAQLKVIGSESVKSYLPGRRDLLVIGQELGTSHLLAGSVRREADQIHVQGN